MDQGVPLEQQIVFDLFDQPARRTDLAGPNQGRRKRELLLHHRTRPQREPARRSRQPPAFL
ncbi:MAG TPA: hypothetical protein VFA00_11950 [Actinomycetota bacterium]|nr:hypothetical protein [Actinomycetota bacterium]